jgi:hypothetical protein
VPRHVAVRVGDRAVLLEDVLPEIALLICAPAIVALVERNPELAVLGHQAPERALLCPHAQNRIWHRTPDAATKRKVARRVLDAISAETALTRRASPNLGLSSGITSDSVVYMKKCL